MKTEYRYYGQKRGLGRRTEVSEVGERRHGTREDVVRRVTVIIGYSQRIGDVQSPNRAGDLCGTKT